MYLTVISPVGFACTLDLDALALWRFEMRPIQLTHVSTKGLAIGIGYVTAGTIGFAVVSAIDCKVMGDELKPVAEIGLPAGERHADKERVREALKALHNTGMPRQEVETIIASSAGLVDCYHDIVQALWGFNKALNSVGPVAQGAVEGWRWALTQDRFSPWIKPTLGEGLGMGAAPGAMPPMGMAPGEKPPLAPYVAPTPTEAVTDELSAASNPLGPPPGTTKKRGKSA